MSHARVGAGRSIKSAVASKDPGPEDPALIHRLSKIPLSGEGVLFDLAVFNPLPEYWSDGVLENLRQTKNLKGMKMEIKGFSLNGPQESRTITPLLQHSLDLFEVKPSGSDLVQRARFSF